MVEKYCCNKKFNEFIFGEENVKTREDKRMVKLELFQKWPFWKYLKINQHMQFTPNEGP